MSTEERANVFVGKCLCGCVSIRLRESKPSVGACHCSVCRKWGGGPFLSVEGHETPEIEGLEHVSVYASSEWAERGFCARCGSHLFYRLKSAPFYAVSAGLFAESGNWPFKLQVFIDEKPANYSFAERTKTMTGEEVFNAWQK